MPSEREKRLLWMLGGAAAVCAFVVVIGLGAERMASAKTTSLKYEAEVAKLSRALPSEAEAVSLRDKLKAELERGKSRFYAPQEMSPFSFGTLVRKKLAARGISVVRYQVVEMKGKSSIEFSVSGTAAALILFLRDVSESEKYWTVSSLTLSMREGTGTADAVFRIEYEVLDAKKG
jgi:hypothetical protein